MSSSVLVLIPCCCCSIAHSCPTLCESTFCSVPGSPVLHHLPELSQTRVHWLGDAIQPFHPLSSPSPPAFNLSQHQVFSKESALCIMWQKYQSFIFKHQFFNQYSWLISFRIDWFDFCEAQGTLKGFIQHHSSKASILQCSAFFMAQLSHPYMTTGKTIALTRWTFVGKAVKWVQRKRDWAGRSGKREIY